MYTHHIWKKQTLHTGANTSALEFLSSCENAHLQKMLRTTCGQQADIRKSEIATKFTIHY